jgi:hypothetical protein
MFRPSNDSTLNVEQVRGLDDVFFASNPLGYFQARVESLLAFADGAVAAYESGAGKEYARALRRAPGDFQVVGEQDRTLQVAIDAMSLRQHVAEAVVRLWAALLEVRGHEPGTVSMWATLTDGKTGIVEVLKQIGSYGEIGDEAAGLLLPAQVVELLRAGDKTAARAAVVLFGWLERAEYVLTRNDIHLSAAHNKVKHGLAVRVRGDVLMSFVRATDMPELVDDTIPLSAVNDSIPIMNKPVVEYLARPPKTSKGAPQGLEVTTLVLDTPTLLAEATMLATVHAAAFHLAATRYVDATGADITIAPYPALPLRPSPEELLGRRVTGMRSPVTRSANPDEPERELGLGFEDGTFIGLQVDFDQHRKVRIVQD